MGEILQLNFLTSDKAFLDIAVLLRTQVEKKNPLLKQCFHLNYTNNFSEFPGTNFKISLTKR